MVWCETMVIRVCDLERDSADIPLLVLAEVLHEEFDYYEEVKFIVRLGQINTSIIVITSFRIQLEYAIRYQQ